MHPQSNRTSFTFLTLITALQALVSPLAPGENSSARTPSKEDISKLSDKLKELLGDADTPQEAVQRNERGEVCTYTGID
jgi:hypothetical protein